MKTSVCGGTCKRQMIRRKMSTNLLQNTLSVHNVFPPHPKKTWKPDQLISGWPFKREIECAGLMTIFVLWLSYRVANWVSSINYQKKAQRFFPYLFLYFLFMLLLPFSEGSHLVALFAIALLLLESSFYMERILSFDYSCHTACRLQQCSGGGKQKEDYYSVTQMLKKKHM